MIIRVNEKEINVKNIISSKITLGTKSYPALRFEFENGAPSEDISTLLEGSFNVVDDDNNVLGTYEGYSTLKEIAVTIGKITTEDEQIADLETQLSYITAENESYKETIESLEIENAKLMFNALTDEDYDTVNNTVE